MVSIKVTETQQHKFEDDRLDKKDNDRLYIYIPVKETYSRFEVLDLLTRAFELGCEAERRYLVNSLKTNPLIKELLK